MSVGRTPGEIFGARVREIRQKRGMTQVELGERLGFQQNRVSEIENGSRSPTLVTILHLAIALQCKPSALTGCVRRGRSAQAPAEVTNSAAGARPYQWCHEVRRVRMPTSTITSKGQTTVPKEVRDALDVGAGDKITWVNGGRVSVSTERPAFSRWEIFIKHGPHRRGESRPRSAEAERAHLTCSASSSMRTSSSRRSSTATTSNVPRRKRSC